MKKIISIALALLMVAVMLPVMAMAADNVAKIGETEYPTLEAAFAAVKNNETIEVMKDCSGNGIVVQSGKNFTVDFSNSAKLRSLIPEEAVFVAESGVKDASDVGALSAIGADAVLVGEALMRAADKQTELARFREAADEQNQD